MVAVALHRLAALVMRAAAAACIATAATVGTAHRSRLRLWLEEAKESGRKYLYLVHIIHMMSWYQVLYYVYLVLPDVPSSSSAWRFLLPQVQPTQTGFGFGFGLKKNLKMSAIYAICAICAIYICR